MRNTIFIVLLICVGMFINGCVSLSESNSAIENRYSDSTSNTNADLEISRFPEYLLTNDFELQLLECIQGTHLVQAGLTSSNDLSTVLLFYEDSLEKKKWHFRKLEEAEQSFRIFATRKGESLEIRAVYGDVVTQIFILYKPFIALESSERN